MVDILIVSRLFGGAPLFQAWAGVGNDTSRGWGRSLRYVTEHLGKSLPLCGVCFFIHKWQGPTAAHDRLEEPSGHRETHQLWQVPGLMRY